MSSHNTDTTDVFGFWLYILSDCILFSMLFGTYAVLHNQMYGPGIGEMSSLSYVLIETMALLFSSFTFGLAILASYRHAKNNVIVALAATFILGAVFVGMELHEFFSLFHEGQTWAKSAGLSAFYALVGTHGLHVTIGLIWMLVLMLQIKLQGITSTISRRLTYLGLFWAFLDIIWIFVFTIVYLMGSI